MAEQAVVPTNGNNRPARRWDPFALMGDFQQEMERFFGHDWPLATFRRPLVPATPWAPRMDVFEKNGNLVVKADLPGVKKEDVHVEMDDGALVIRGESRAEQEVKEEDYYRMERSSGAIYRRLPLPTGIDPGQIKAAFADGVLEVTIPKPAEAKAAMRDIPIN